MKAIFKHLSSKKASGGGIFPNAGGGGKSMGSVLRQVAANRPVGGGLFPNTGGPGTFNDAFMKAADYKSQTGQLFPDMTALGGIQRKYISPYFRTISKF